MLSQCLGDGLLSPLTQRLTTEGLVPISSARVLRFPRFRISRSSQVESVLSDMQIRVLDKCVRWSDNVPMQQITSARYRATSVTDTLRAQGRTVTWLAQRIGLSRQYTSDVVHGHVAVGEEVAERISAILGVSLFLVFDVSDSTENVPETKASAA